MGSSVTSIAPFLQNKPVAPPPLTEEQNPPLEPVVVPSGATIESLQAEAIKLQNLSQEAIKASEAAGKPLSPDTLALSDKAQRVNDELMLLYKQISLKEHPCPNNVTPDAEGNFMVFDGKECKQHICKAPQIINKNFNTLEAYYGRVTGNQNICVCPPGTELKQGKNGIECPPAGQSRSFLSLRGGRKGRKKRGTRSKAKRKTGKTHRKK